jgi:hypothetical protein
VISINSKEGIGLKGDVHMWEKGGMENLCNFSPKKSYKRKTLFRIYFV